MNSNMPKIGAKLSKENWKELTWSSAYDVLQVENRTKFWNIFCKADAFEITLLYKGLGTGAEK